MIPAPGRRRGGRGPATGPAPPHAAPAAPPDDDWDAGDDGDRERGGAARWVWVAAALVLLLLLGRGRLVPALRPATAAAAARPRRHHLAPRTSAGPTGIQLDPAAFIGRPADEVQAAARGAGPGRSRRDGAPPTQLAQAAGRPSAPATWRPSTPSGVVRAAGHAGRRSTSPARRTTPGGRRPTSRPAADAAAADHVRQATRRPPPRPRRRAAAPTHHDDGPDVGLAAPGRSAPQPTRRQPAGSADVVRRPGGDGGGRGRCARGSVTAASCIELRESRAHR